MDFDKDGYRVEIIIVNRTSDAQIKIGRATTAVQAQVIGDTHPVIKVNEEALLLCSLYAGFRLDARRDRLVIPVTIASGGAAVSGTIQMYTAVGSSFPDHVYVDLNVGEMKVPTQLDASVFDTVTAAMGNIRVGRVTFVFSDLGANTVTTKPDEYPIDLLKMGVSAIT